MEFGGQFMTSGSGASRSPAGEMADYEDWGSVRIAQLEQQDLERYQRELESQRRIVQMRRPIQRFEMRVSDYYQRFCYWKEEMISVGYPNDESIYIDYFIGDLQWQIGLRVLECRSTLSKLIDAYYAAHHHEVMIRLDEFIQNFSAPNRIEEMASQSTDEIQGDDICDKVEEEAEPCTENQKENTAEPIAHNLFDEMSKPNPSDFQMERVYNDIDVTGNVVLNEIKEVFNEMPKPIQQSFYMKSLAPSKPENQLGDKEVQYPLMKMGCLKVVRNLFDELKTTLQEEVMNDQLTNPGGMNFNNVTLFDPGGNRKYTMSSSGGFVFELFGKAYRICDNAVKEIDGRKNVMKSDACSDLCICFDELTEVSPTALFNGQVIEHYAHYLLDECPQPFFDEQSDRNGRGVDKGGVVLPIMDLQSVLNPMVEITMNDSCKGSTKAMIGKSASIMESVSGKIVMKDHAHKVSDRMTDLIVTARHMVSLAGNQLFDVMEQSFWSWINSTEAYYLMLDDIRVRLSDRNNNGTQVLVFDPGTSAIGKYEQKLDNLNQRDLIKFWNKVREPLYFIVVCHQSMVGFNAAIKMMYGGTAVFLFDLSIRHLKGRDSIASSGIPRNSVVDLWVGKVLLCFDPSGNTFVLGTWSLRNTLSKRWDRLNDDTSDLANYLSSHDTSALKAINGFLMMKTYSGRFDFFDVFLEMLVDYWKFALLIPIHLTHGRHLCNLRYLHEIICSAFSIVIKQIQGMDYGICENEFPCCWNLGSSYDILCFILVVLSQNVILFYILEDKDSFEGAEKKILSVVMIRSIKDNHFMSKTKGMAIQLALVLKQDDEKLNRAYVYYYAHKWLLACSVVDKFQPGEHFLHKNEILWRNVSLINRFSWPSVAPLVRFPWPSVAPLVLPFICMASKHVEASRRLGALMLLTICDVLALLTRKLKTVEDAYGDFPNAKQSCIVVQTDHIIVEDWHYSEILVTFRSVGLDCEDIIDARRLKRFDADSKLHVFVQSLTNKDIKPSPQFVVALSTLWLEHYIWDPGSSAALMGGYCVVASGNVTQYWKNGRDLYGICMRCKAESLVTFGRSNNIYSQWLDVHKSTTFGHVLVKPRCWDYNIHRNTKYIVCWIFFGLTNTFFCRSFSRSLAVAINHGCDDQTNIHSQLVANVKNFGFGSHFTTLRTRRLLRGRTCHDPRFSR